MWLNSVLMSKKILIISGPTATGKTDLAIKLAKKYNGLLISADSRQIYQGLDIGTGKDHPSDIKIHLIDILTPDQSFSVSQFQQLAFEKIHLAHQHHQLPIIVGGTGHYIDAIVNPQRDTYHLKPKRCLRFFLNKLSLKNLQKIYQILDKKNFNSLNNSEKHNPHRLIRKIEIKLSLLFSRDAPRGVSTNHPSYDIFHLSLTAPTSFLYHRIDQRIQKRLSLGLLNEIKTLLKTYKWSDPGLNTLAYKEFRDYFTVRASLADAQQKWRFDEHAYARRQLTWFKKRPEVVFIDITQPKYSSQIFSLVKKWYNSL